MHHFSLGEWDGTAFAFFLACVLKRARIGLTMDYCPDEFVSSPPKPASPAAEALRRLFYSRCEWVSAFSARTAAAAAIRFPDLNGRIRVVPNGWSLEEKRRLAPRPSRDGSPKAAGKPFVFCLARLSRHRAIDIVLMAWRDVSKEIDGALLELGGPDHERGYYQKLAERLGILGNLRFLGQLDRTQVWRKMEECLFFVFPARYSGSCQGAMEAMSCGKAVVASDAGAASAVIEDGVSGLLVLPTDVAGLSRKMGQLYRDADLRMRLGAAGRERAQRCEWGRIGESYANLWNERPA